MCEIKTETVEDFYGPKYGNFRVDVLESSEVFYGWGSVNDVS